MQQRLKKGANRVVGTKQVLRALEQDALERVTLALDAAPALRGRIEAAAREKEAHLQDSFTKLLKI